MKKLVLLISILLISITYEQALPALKQSIDLNAKFAPSHYYLGYALYKLNYRKDAIEEFRETLRIAPGYTSAYLELGKALSAQGQHKSAREAWYKVIELDSESDLANQARGLLAKYK